VNLTNKISTFCFILLLFPVGLIAQEYHPLIRQNTYWDCYTWQSGWWCYSSVNRIFFTGADTLLDGKTYQISYAYPMYPDPPGPWLCPPFVIDTIAVDHEHYVREDTVEQKVYINTDIFLEPDAILYDFTLQPGDTLKSGYHWLMGIPLIVSSVDSVMIATGEYRKRINFNETKGENYYIESIGGSQGLFTPLLTHEQGGGFLCVKENNINLWGDECEYWFVNIQDQEIEQTSISPNPASTHITIETPYQGQISIFNLHGQELICRQITESKTVIDISTLPSGVYLVKVTGERAVQVGKFVKQ